MSKKVDFFLPYYKELTDDKLQALLSQESVNNIYLLTKGARKRILPEGCQFLKTDGTWSIKSLFTIADAAETDFLFLYLKTDELTLGYHAIERFIELGEQTKAEMLYSDYNYKKGETITKHPLLDFTCDTIRDDFEYGPLLYLKRETLFDDMESFFDYDGTVYKEEAETVKATGSAGLYYFYTQQATLGSLSYHIKEFLYTETEIKTGGKGESQFNYVDPRNLEYQKQLEYVFTKHLKAGRAYIPANELRKVGFETVEEFPVEASVIIPVFNRVRTIKDAINSALEQQTTFKYNILVIDNHSTDGTTEEIDLYADDKRVVHLIPEHMDLGIGGCWDYAIRHKECGRFAVQLDSDDLYSSPATLQTIIDGFYQQNCAMLVGSYRITDFNLNTIPPGVIDHREWTEENGHNNLLRVNGVGAPRAFFTPILREYHIPNVSYGEDYAISLAISSKYKIGRIFDVLYLCRRWEGNSDATLSQEKINANNLYKDSIRRRFLKSRHKNERYGSFYINFSDFLKRQLNFWPSVAQNYKDLEEVKERNLGQLIVQWNPKRIQSTTAKIQEKDLKERACFLCKENRSVSQDWISFDEDMELLVNPYPILKEHFTLACKEHEPQVFDYRDLMGYLPEDDKYIQFYNGPKCGASAPDHLHYQIGTMDNIPLLNNLDKYTHKKVSLSGNQEKGPFVYYITDYCVPVFMFNRYYDVFINRFTSLFEQFLSLFNKEQDDTEVMLNAIAFHEKETGYTRFLLFPRKKHRPDCYFAQGEDQILVSPGALDMAGLIITPREEDFNKLTEEKAEAILREVSISREEADEIIAKIEQNPFKK